MKYIVLYLTCCCWIAHSVEAQDSTSDRSDRFFEKGFATKGLSNPYDVVATPEEEKKLDPKNSAQEPKAEKDAKNPLFDKFHAEAQQEEDDKEEDADTEEASETEEVSGVPVKAVGLIVNSKKPEHAVKFLRVLEAFSTRTSLKISKIYLIGGNYKELKAAGAFEKISSQFPLIFPRSSIPSNYDVKRSPTWIFDTKDGEILVEGLENPNGIINSKNELIGESN